MNHLLPGLRNFREQIFPQQQKFFESLSQGQKPHTLMITCSDSRIDPNLVTQTKPGEIFVVRNAGNIIPPFGASRGGEEAAIEFAIEGLGVSNIVICGHSQCGAMAALMGKVNLDGLPSMKNWLKHSQATRKRVEVKYNNDCDLLRVVEENALVQAENLKTHPSVSASLSAGRTRIFAWVYRFESGSMAVYDPKLKKYLPSAEVNEETEKDVSRYAI
jgi:carbonic anhydrase